MRGGVRHSGLLDEQVYTTDAKGEIKVSWKQGGMYWVNASWPKREAAPQGGQPQYRQAGSAGTGRQPPAMPPFRASYTATLEVLP